MREFNEVEKFLILGFIFFVFPSETSPVLSIIVASVSFVIIILILVVFILFCRRTKKRLKPADVIPVVSTRSPFYSREKKKPKRRENNLRMKCISIFSLSNHSLEHANTIER